MLEKKIKFIPAEKNLNFLFSENQVTILTRKMNVIDLPSNCYSGLSNSFAFKVINDSIKKKVFMVRNNNLRVKVSSFRMTSAKSDLHILISDEFEKCQYKKESVKHRK